MATPIASPSSSSALSTAGASPASSGEPSRPGLSRAGAAAESERLPDGISVQPRRFEFHELDAIPKYWFGGNKLLTHMEMAFSLMIPPGEAFFIRSVRAYADCAKDPETQELVRAFAQQEGWHMRAHNDFNASFARHGLDVEAEVAYANETIETFERRLPKKMRLGATAFLEHLTAVGANVLFTEPDVGDLMHPEARRFWRWHAAEELEHKAVAFDLFEQAGGGYFLRIASAFAALFLLAGPLRRQVIRLMKNDPEPVTPEMREQARALNRKLAGPELRMLARYFKPGFHPWDEKDEKHLAAWYQEAAAQ